MIPLYLDCNATTPIDPRVAALVREYLEVDFGNAGSRTHLYGEYAKKAVERARKQLAAVVDADGVEIIFTSGATESNNIALLGLTKLGIEQNKKHIITTLIEHPAVLEPLQEMERRGFEITHLPCSPSGRIDPQDLLNALRPNTLLVSIMHVNNETGIIQPIEDICKTLNNTSHQDVYLHVDAAQSFGKLISPLQNKRIDLISVSGHKIYGPKGIGALVRRLRNKRRTPLEPLMYGGGQEDKLRPGTLPVPLVAGLGLAAELAFKEHEARRQSCLKTRQTIMDIVSPLNPVFNGDQDHCITHTLNLSFPGVESESLFPRIKNLIALANGAACASHKYTQSHVLSAMQLPKDVISSALRLSWCHMTADVEAPLREFAKIVPDLKFSLDDFLKPHA